MSGRCDACALALALVLFAACASDEHVATAPARATRLLAGESDTIIINSRAPTALAIRALDAAGRVIADRPILHERVAGDSMDVTTSGIVTCARTGDVLVRAVLETVSTHVLVRCRPVEHVRLAGPVQFILGDSALSLPVALPVEAYRADGQRVATFAGTAHVADSSIAMPVGLTLHPRVRGITITSAYVGDRSGTTGVHIYQRVDTLAALDTLLRVKRTQRLFAVPLRLGRGEMRRQRLPPGGWMLAMMPEEIERSHGLRLRVEGARCTPNLLNTPRRFGCEAGPDAAVVIYRAFGGRDTAAATGYLLVRAFQ